MLIIIKFLFLFTNIFFVQFENVISVQRPNILIILADDLGWGDVSFHGTRQIPTPNIDLLASSGVIMNNYYVSPLCSPSRSALLTGLNPIRTGMQVDVIAASQPYGLPLNYTTMGQHFQRLGYQTHAVGKWHQGFFRSEYLPTRRGFDTYLGYLTGHSDYFNRKAGDLFHGYDLHEMDHVANLSEYQGQYSTDMYTDRVVKLIEENQFDQSNQKPWLIYMAQQSVHGAEVGNEIQPPPRHENDHKYIRQNERRRRFAGMVAALDESIGRVFKALNDTNQLSNTIIVFSTDNGGATGSIYGAHIDNSQGSNWPLKGGKYTLWEGGVRGTAFIWSRLFPKSFVNNQLMHITDILPTLYTASGGNISDLGNIDGHNQWNQLMNPNENNYEIRTHLLHNIDHTNHFWAIRYRNYKLTNGTILLGHFDNWYEAPGQQTEYPSEGICYNCTTTFKILEEHSITFEPITVRIDCKRERNPLIECQSTNGFCLFDIEQDPCELTNLAEKRSDIVEKIYRKIYKYYNEQYEQPVNKPYDSRANPSNHGGFWKPWLDDDDDDEENILQVPVT
ncbi:arylsulfatase B-like protein [Euroglyphus maynei]|uniref:Arylsulfatase B-like protein n=1 Tax=Euroglyphus maynei TaxID=6958 RepID=A0A1Y3AMX9_EURMA|nr:arylsulfatase B-like protein [Euroglyphus maynei]